MTETTTPGAARAGTPAAGYGDGHAHGPSYRLHFAVWGALVLLTGFTILMAELQLGAATIAAVLAVAAAKSTLVIFWFMHLRYEKKLVIKLLIPIVVATLAVFIGLTYTDILYR